MEKEIYNVNEAIVLLKEGVALKDKNANIFVLKKELINVYSKNSSYKLKSEDFLQLYKENEFVVFSDDDANIDSKKDEEYYGFKHK